MAACHALSVDGSVYLELWVAGSKHGGADMAKKSNLNRLVRKHLPLVVCLIELINQVIDFVGKAVNYASQVRKLRILVLERTEEACFRS